MYSTGLEVIGYNRIPSFAAVIKRRPLSLMISGLIFGALQVFAFAPFFLWLLLPVSVLPLLWVLENLPRHPARWFTYWYGAGFWLATTHWIYNSFTHFVSTSLILSAMLVVLFALAMALFWVLLALLWQWLSRPFGFYGYIEFSPLLKSLLFPACWLGIEWFRSTVFQGFPWLLSGYSMMDVPFIPLTRWLPITGIWGLSALAILGCSSLFYAMQILFGSNTPFLRSRVPAAMILLITPIIIVSASWLLPRDWSTTTDNTLRLGLVQPSIPLSEKWNASLSTRNLLLLRQLSLPLKDQVDAIIWPESAIAGPWQSHELLLGSIRESLQPASFISGTLRYGDADQSGRIYNSIGNFSDKGRDFYDKRQLVPFGEFMPLHAQLSGILKSLGFPVSNLTPSANDRSIFRIGDFPLLASICYEVIFPHLMNTDLTNGQALLNISDDGWFGDSLGPQQHFQMARARALETARPMVRVGNDGITALVNHHGEVIDRLPRFARDTLVVTVRGREGRTPFSIIGNWAVLILMAIPVLTCLTMRFAYRKRIE